MAAKKNILVFYYTRGVYPLRSTIHDHLYCWRQYSKHNIIYVNVAMGVPVDYLSSIRIDVIIYHTSFCGMRWSQSVFYNFTALTADFNDHPAYKIAIPQDEFTKTDMLCEFLNECHIDCVLTCAYDSEWEAIYGSLDQNRVRFKTVLTGYLDDHTVNRSRSFIKPLKDRSIGISYRAWRAAYWLGEHATHKVKVGEIFQKKGPEAGFNCDISLDDGATLLGDDWLKFLADSRATIGVEGGASILDKDGSIKTRVDSYVADNPRASFEETREACFKGQDNHFNLSCLSPRHLEAVATKTVQILIDGEFNGILIKNRHFITLKPDYSNIDETLAALKDDSKVQAMIDLAYEEIVKPGRFTYRGFVQEIEAEIIDKAPLANLGRSSLWKRFVMGIRDYINWRLIEGEVHLMKKPNARMQKHLDRIRHAFVALPDWG